MHCRFSFREMYFFSEVASNTESLLHVLCVLVFNKVDFKSERLLFVFKSFKKIHNGVVTNYVITFQLHFIYIMCTYVYLQSTYLRKKW